MDAYHLTLLFVGEVGDLAAADFDSVLESTVVGQDSFRLQLRQAGCFPLGSRAVRVAWIGVRDEKPVCRLQARIAGSLASSGLIDLETRPYHPHLTVARCRKPWNRDGAEKWKSSLLEELGEDFQVDSIILFRSRLSSNGARYEKFRTYPFGGAK